VQLVKPGTIYFDVGAHVGFYTLLASSLVQESGHVFAFEPLPRNISYLETHLEINAIENVTVIESAVSDHAGEARFDGASDKYAHARGFFSKGQLSDVGSILVPVVSLDELVLHGKLPMPDYLKIDVEGAELAVLNGARQLLTTGRPTIFLATHGAEVHADCVAMLQSLEYECSALDPQAGINSCDEILAVKKV
jgi:FkbM family methyltransferase